MSKTEGLNDGDALTVSITGFAAGGKPAKLVIAGQGKLVTIPDKLNFDEYAVAPEIAIAADGTGTGQMVALADHGTVQDGTTLNCLTQQCWVVAVQEPFLPQPNYASVPIFFAGGSVVPTATTAPVTETTAVVVAETTTTVAETTTTSSTTTTTEPEATTTTEVVDTTGDTGDDEGGSGLTYAIIAGVAALAAAGGFLATRRKPPTDSVAPTDGAAGETPDFDPNPPTEQIPPTDPGPPPTA